MDMERIWIWNGYGTDMERIWNGYGIWIFRPVLAQKLFSLPQNGKIMDFVKIIIWVTCDRNRPSGLATSIYFSIDYNTGD
jgi:hypothetical protein